MIRHRHADEFILITQDDHARLSGLLASHIGNDSFARPEPATAVVEAIALHDSGWPLHDSQPTLNPQGFPLHVFETPPELAVGIWTESVQRAARQGDYTGLLVSLHVMALSMIAQSHYASPRNRLVHARQVFELNKFQQNQIEAQENFRGRLGMRTDLALHYGMAAPGISAAEDALLFNYNLLKAMDRLSLAVLCSEPLFETIEGVYPRPGAKPIELRLRNEGEWTIRVSPWPFDQARIEAQVPCRRIPARAMDAGAFLRAYEAATVQMQKVCYVMS
ncbi:MAG TPA: DUF3891 family protein [Humisphaera sp.]|jgi:hypothetical protein|nr:DUF3891 family protein [Humisphaera sp.]